MTPQQLMTAALDRRSVVGFHWNIENSERPMPAAFLIGMPFSVVMRRIGDMKLYEKRKVIRSASTNSAKL